MQRDKTPRDKTSKLLHLALPYIVLYKNSLLKLVRALVGSWELLGALSHLGLRECQYFLALELFGARNSRSGLMQCRQSARKGCSGAALVPPGRSKWLPGGLVPTPPEPSKWLFGLGLVPPERSKWALELDLVPPKRSTWPLGLALLRERSKWPMGVRRREKGRRINHILLISVSPACFELCYHS